MGWRDFWNGDHSIYAGERHRVLHYRLIATDMAALVPAPDASVLDYGCGEALSADLVAAACARLYLYDSAPRVQEALKARWAQAERIVVLDDAGLAGLPPHSLDVIVANSIAQYISRGEFEALLDRWRDSLKPSARLILGDVIPPNSNALLDAWQLLRFAARGGFLTKALRSLVATFFSDYRKLRRQVGLSRYDAREVLDLLSAHGLEGRRTRVNIGHNQRRMMFIATPRRHSAEG